MSDDRPPSNLSSELEQQVAEQDAAELKSQLAAVRKELADTRAATASLAAQNRRLADSLTVIEQAISHERPEGKEPPVWLTQPPRKSHSATVCLLLTDPHFTEVVDVDQVQGANQYDNEIADQRLRRCIEGVVKLSKHYMSGVTYDGCVVFMGGDMFSGNIHEELRVTNAGTLFEGLYRFLDPVAAALSTLAHEFGRVHVAGVPGNHGRLTRKPIAKSRAVDNLDWLFYVLLERDFHRDDRVTWQIPKAADTLVPVHGVRYQLTHGDQFRGGTGISGAMAPLALGQHRKSRRAAQIGKPYDYLVHGHWHQQAAWKQIISGGSLKGYDEYAYVNNFDFEPPQQALWYTTPERGITFQTSVFVEDRAEEKW